MEGNALEEKHTPRKQDRSLFHLPAWLRHSGEHTHAHTHTHTHTGKDNGCVSFRARFSLRASDRRRLTGSFRLLTPPPPRCFSGGKHPKRGRRWKQIPSQTGSGSTAGALWIIWWLQSCDEALPSIKSAALGAYFTFTPQTLEGDD